MGVPIFVFVLLFVPLFATCQLAYASLLVIVTYDSIGHYRIGRVAEARRLREIPFLY